MLGSMKVSTPAHVVSPVSHMSPGIQNHSQTLDVHNVETQTTRLPDILTTFCMALHNESKASLLLFAESLRVRALLSLPWHFSHKIM